MSNWHNKINLTPEEIDAYRKEAESDPIIQNGLQIAEYSITGFANIPKEQFVEFYKSLSMETKIVLALMLTGRMPAKGQIHMAHAYMHLLMIDKNLSANRRN